MRMAFVRWGEWAVYRNERQISVVRDCGSIDGRRERCAWRSFLG